MTAPSEGGDCALLHGQDGNRKTGKRLEESYLEGQLPVTYFQLALHLIFLSICSKSTTSQRTNLHRMSCWRDTVYSKLLIFLHMISPSESLIPPELFNVSLSITHSLYCCFQGSFAFVFLFTFLKCIVSDNKAN